MFKKIRSALIHHWSLAIALCLFTGLLLRNPYSTRTLIPNFEPFPDAFYYITTPLCFLQGEGWKMCRLHNPEIQGIETVVGPLYSLTLLPSFLVSNDPRTFYFSNIFLAFLSVFLLYKISIQFFKNQLITSVILLFYVTNYYVYWYPSLAMAENVLVPLFLLSLYLLQSKLTKKNILLAGIVVPSFYAAKYAYVSLSAVFLVFYLLKIVLESKKKRRELCIRLAFFFTPVLILGLMLFDLAQLLFFFNNIFVKNESAASSTTTSSAAGYFSTGYILKHLPKYSAALFGKSERFLWSTTPLLSSSLAITGLVGHAVVWTKKQTIPKLYMLAAGVLQLLFMSSFYVVDIRYVFHLLPILLIGFGFLVSALSKKIVSSFVFSALMAIVVCVYLFSNAQRLKSQIMINLKYAETPWWQLSIVEANTYFEKIASTEKNKPYLITLAAPFLHDYYPSSSYKLLPMHPQQDFHNFREEVWGESKDLALLDLYAQKMRESSVFITTYGTAATPSFKAVFDEIKQTFDLIEVQNGCHTTCVIYQLYEKK